MGDQPQDNSWAEDEGIREYINSLPQKPEKAKLERFNRTALEAAGFQKDQSISDRHDVFDNHYRTGNNGAYIVASTSPNDPLMVAATVLRDRAAWDNGALLEDVLHETPQFDTVKELLAYLIYRGYL